MRTTVTILALFAAHSASAKVSEAEFTKLNGTSSRVACFGMISSAASLNTDLNRTLESYNKTLQALYDATNKGNPRAPKFEPIGSIYMFKDKTAHMEVVSNINAYAKTLKEVKDTKTMLAFQEHVSGDIASALEKEGVEYFEKCESTFLEMADKCKGFADNREMLKDCFTREMTKSERIKDLNEHASGNAELKNLIEQSKKQSKR